MVQGWEGEESGEASPFSSDTIYSLVSLRKSTPPQNRQLDVLVLNDKQ